MDFSQLFENLATQFLGKLQEILPLMPDIPVDFLSSVNQFMSWLNWFFPVSMCLQFTGGVLACVAAFYGVRIILKLLHLI